MFDVADHLDELRSWPTERLVARREELVRVQREARTEELTVVRVLDERGQIDVTMASRDGVSERTMRDTVETARALEGLPAIAAAAHAGELSSEQLGSAVRLADEESDAEWARRAPNTAPAELARLARTQVKPSLEDSRRRYEARSLRMWWTADKTMLHIHGQLPDLMGAKVEATINRMTDRAKPVKGRPWDSYEHRAADALGGMCDAVEVAEQVETPTLAAKPLVVVQVPMHGPAEIAGIPLADAVVEQLRANAGIEPVLVDDDGVPVVVGKRTAGLSPKVMRAVLLRDGHCRCGNCEVRYGLQIHHLRPKSWGGTDDPANLAAVCVPAGHHQMLVPHGPWALVGNPNRPDGLRLVHLDELTEAGAVQLGLPPPRAGPSAA
jgi:hypothetical protein